MDDNGTLLTGPPQRLGLTQTKSIDTDVPSSCLGD